MIERNKINEVAARSVNTYFWRTYDQKEIDSIEERKGRLFGYEFKYSDGDIRSATKREFLSAYPSSELSVINKDNFEPFII